MNPIAGILKSLRYFCDGYMVHIPPQDPQFGCLVCHDYYSCQSCQSSLISPAPHLGTHPTRAFNVSDASATPPSPSTSHETTEEQTPDSQPENHPCQSAAEETSAQIQDDSFGNKDYYDHVVDEERRGFQLVLEAHQLEQIRRAQHVNQMCMAQTMQDIAGGWMDSDGLNRYHQGYIR